MPKKPVMKDSATQAALVEIPQVIVENIPLSRINSIVEKDMSRSESFNNS